MKVTLVRETYVEFVHITITYGFLHEDIWTMEKARSILEPMRIHLSMSFR